MADDHHGHGGHASGNEPIEWLILHMGDVILSFGRAFEGVMEKIMMPAVNGFFGKAARAYLFIVTPILAFVFIVMALGHGSSY